ncbi:hypothetical protein HK405_010504, partial [Cladochytrium tenue]
MDDLDEVEVMPGVYLLRRAAPAATSAVRDGRSSNENRASGEAAPYYADMDAAHLVDEIARVELELSHLERSNREIAEFVLTDPDPEFDLALAENTAAMSRRRADIAGMRKALGVALTGGVNSAAAAAAAVGPCAGQLLQSQDATPTSPPPPLPPG